MNALDRIKKQLRGSIEAQNAADERARNERAAAERKDAAWVAQRSAQLRSQGHHAVAADTLARNELRAAKQAEGDVRERARVDEAVKAVAEHDAGAMGRLEDALRHKASTPVDHEARKAEERQRRRIASELDVEDAA